MSGAGLLKKGEEIIMTSISNPEVMAICYAQGWAANADYMTKSEAEAVTRTNDAFKNHTEITHFNEFKYFTGFTSDNTDIFDGCSSLEELTIPYTLDSIGGWNTFRNCSSLTRINITDLDAYLNMTFARGNSCPTSNGADLYLNGVKVTTITAVKCGGYQFYGCKSIEHVTLPDTITSIGYGSFQNCTSLTTINIPPYVTDISYYAFGSCTNLIFQNNILNLPSTLTSLWDYFLINVPRIGKIVFAEGCSINITSWRLFYYAEFTTMDIPSTMTSVPNVCKAGLNYRINLLLRGNSVKTLQGQSYYNVSTTGRYIYAYVPDDLVESYKADSSWASFNQDLILPLSSYTE